MESVMSPIEMEERLKQLIKQVDAHQFILEQLTEQAKRNQNIFATKEDIQAIKKGNDEMLVGLENLSALLTAKDQCDEHRITPEKLRDSIYAKVDSEVANPDPEPNDFNDHTPDHEADSQTLNLAGHGDDEMPRPKYVRYDDKYGEPELGSHDLSDDQQSLDSVYGEDDHGVERL